METDKVYERVLEMQKNIESSSAEERSSMLTELFNIVSQIEQSLSEIKLDINEIENNTKNEE